MRQQLEAICGPIVEAKGPKEQSKRHLSSMCCDVSCCLIGAGRSLRLRCATVMETSCTYALQARRPCLPL